MEATAPGQNRTGAAVTPDQINLMLEAVRELSPPVPINTLSIDVERQSYISAAESVGSIPHPKLASKGTVQRTKAEVKGASPSVLMDKLGERIAFERAGTRLYDALISKYLALSNAGQDVLPAIESLAMEVPEAAVRELRPGETALDTLRRIRLEELRHFQMLCEAMADRKSVV